MATAVGLNMKITADTAGIGRGMSRTEKLLQGLDRNAQSAAKSLSAIATVQVGGAIIRSLASVVSTVSGAVSSFTAYASRLANAADETAKLAQRTGISVEAIQAFQVAADLAGVDNLEGALQKLSVVIGDAASGSESAIKAFDRIGISIDTLTTLSPEEQFRAIAKAIARIPDAASRASAAVDLFGRSGVELLPLFESNLADIEERAKKLGIVLSEDQTSAIEQMNDSLSLVRKTIDGIIGQVVANLAPVVTAIAEEFLSFVEGFQGLNGATGGNAIADALTEGVFFVVEILAKVFDDAVVQFAGFAVTMEGVSKVFSAVANLLVGWAEYLRAVFNLFQGAVDGLGILLGKFLQMLPVALGTREFGKELEKSSTESARKNAAEFKDAAANMAEAINNALNGGPVNVPGQGPAQTTVQSLREKFRELSAEREARFAEREQKRLFDRLTNNFLQANEVASQTFGKDIPQAVQDAAAGVEQALNAALSDSVISEEEAKAISEAQGRYNAALREGKQALEERAKREKLLEENQKKIDEAMAERNKRLGEIEAERLDELSRRSNEALKISDVRNGGFSDVLRIAAGREDPAIAEYRKQLQTLRSIDAKIAELGADRIEIMGNGARGRAA